MGCSPSSHNRCNNEYIFNSHDISYLTQSWNIIKTQNLQKFAHNVLIRTSNQCPKFRLYWQSKILVDGNNYDYSQHDSCLRTDSSWQVGLRDYSIQFASIFDQLLTDIHNENRFLTQIRSMDTSESIFLIDYEALLIMKKCMMEILHECFKMINCDSIDGYEKAWNKFLTFIIEYMIKQKSTVELTTSTIIKKAE